MIRLGYDDLVKQEGPLPRIKNDSARIMQQQVYKPNHAWTASKALAGQNDYIGRHMAAGAGAVFIG